MSLDIINPYFKIDPENNIFKIRRTEYDKLKDTIQEILNPVLDEGFEIQEFGFKDSYSLEIERTLKKTLVIKLKKGENLIDLSMQIPKLSEDNYLVIGGKRKIPIFQLYDLPIVTRSNPIKIRTNVTSISIIERDEFPYIQLSFMKGKAPIAPIFFATFTAEEMNEKFSLSSIEKPENPSTGYEKLIYDLKCYYDNLDGMEKEDFVEEVGRFYSPSDYKKKGEAQFLL